ncbi:MAG: DcaP family trimeric outer membrane transporter, partial [Stellaceae bacterium]
TLDFGGDVGQAGVVRIPQVRYTYAGPWGSAWSMSLETPQTDVITPGGKVTSDTNLAQNPVARTQGGASTSGCVANGVTVGGTASPTFSATSACAVTFNGALAKAPDITFASYWSQPWGHVDFRLVGRPGLTINDGRFVNRDFFGYGGGISGSVQPHWFGWAKDNFVWQFTIGNGIGRYMNESDDAALATNMTVAPATTEEAANIIVRPIPEFGASAGYQHWWWPNLRSNVSFGISREQIPSNLIGPLEATFANKQVMTAHVNLIWSPVAFVDTGIEYMWGQRTVVANIRGTEQALIGKFAVKF